ncbi:MAG: hypothetical protein PHU66_09600 [Bacteroidaceae bacterium]|nr:hypothetical protein [Bacteroidaceae bacterium]
MVRVIGGLSGGPRGAGAHRALGALIEGAANLIITSLKNVSSRI